MIRQAVGEDSMSLHGVLMKRPKSPRPRKTSQVESKVKNILIIFLDVEGIVYKKLF
jgi:hypothetical protein